MVAVPVITLADKECDAVKKRTIAVVLLIGMMASGLFFKDKLICLYVSLCRDKLESYSMEMLRSDERTTGKYGAWKTSGYPEEKMVEFQTGGWGLAPSSTYKGFYYSADDMHKLFSAAYADTVTMEIDGDNATWTDGTDNHGMSARITEKWFWFEASF